MRAQVLGMVGGSATRVSWGMLWHLESSLRLDGLHLQRMKKGAQIISLDPFGTPPMSLVM